MVDEVAEEDVAAAAATAVEEEEGVVNVTEEGVELDVVKLFEVSFLLTAFTFVILTDSDKDGLRVCKEEVCVSCCVELPVNFSI